MSIFEELSNSTDHGSAASKEFATKTFEHAKLKVFQLSTFTLSMITKLLVIGGLFLLSVFFISMSSAIALGEYLENPALGYLSIGLFLLIISILLFVFRKSFDKKIITKMAELFFD